MTKGISGRRPAPEPVTQMARRLEAIRKRFGVPSLRAFHARLAEGWDSENAVSYEAVRNYHYDRDAPAAYLARVAEVFDVRIGYLVSGEGGMTAEEERARTAIAEVADQAIPGGRERGRQFQARFEEGFGFGGYVPYRLRPWTPALMEVADAQGLHPSDLGEALRGLLDALKIDPRPMPLRTFHAYVFSMIPVLWTLGEEQRRGRRQELSELVEARLGPALKKAVENLGPHDEPQTTEEAEDGSGAATSEPSKSEEASDAEET